MIQEGDRVAVVIGVYHDVPVGSKGTVRSTSVWSDWLTIELGSSRHVILAVNEVRPLSALELLAEVVEDDV